MFKTVIKFGENVVHDMWPMVCFDPGKSIGRAMADVAKVGGDNGYTIYVATAVYPWPEVGTAEQIVRDILKAKTVIAEDFRLYSHKANELSWNALPAARSLGFIEGMAVLERKPLTLQMAVVGKQVTDAFLESVFTHGGLPKTAHERDALRHLVRYWLGLAKT